MQHANPPSSLFVAVSVVITALVSPLKEGASGYSNPYSTDLVVQRMEHMRVVFLVVLHPIVNLNCFIECTQAPDGISEVQ
jgi:hypothetical protein